MWRAVCLLVLGSILSGVQPAHAYSVLAHQAVVDSAWDDVIVPVLRQRYPRADATAITAARAFAYGGSVIQDLGYYPFGSRLFSNLTHYVRSGDFVEALVREAQDVNEFAFALGAVAHYLSDNVGHPGAVNRAVALVYPKLRARYGDEVIYAEDPRRHVMVEFAFDVVQVATGAYLPDAFRAYIGFEVARPVLERAFFATYGLPLDRLFLDTDLAIGTYRYAVSQTIPEMTRVAWKEKQDEIRQLVPSVRPEAFIFSFTRRDYEQAFGTEYRKPGVFARVLGWLVRILPKVGPLAPLAFRVPTAEAERLFTESFRATRDRFRSLVPQARDGRIELPNTDFDVGRPPRWGDNALADETYADLLQRLADGAANPADPAPEPLLRDVSRFFATIDARAQPQRQKEIARIRRLLERLGGA